MHQFIGFPSKHFVRSVKKLSSTFDFLLGVSGGIVTNFHFRDRLEDVGFLFHRLQISILGIG